MLRQRLQTESGIINICRVTTHPTSENETVHPLPHQYQVSATASPGSKVSLATNGAPLLESEAPIEFGGPGGSWSPETLLTAAVADCFILSFRAIASATKFDWCDLSCNVEATLDRADGGMRFVGFALEANLTIASEDGRNIAERLLHKAEKSCLITNSLLADNELHTEIRIVD